MVEGLQILLAFAFYAIMWYIYRYCKGKYKVNESKREAYMEWVEKHGRRTERAIRVLTIIFSLLFFLRVVGGK